MLGFVSLSYKVYIVLYSLVAIVHLAGLILLNKSKNEIPNQRILLQNIALVEMLLCLGSVTMLAIWFSVDNRMIIQCLDALFTNTFFIEMKMAVLHIIFDRFLEIFMNIKYPLYMTRKKMLRLLAMHWIFSFTSSIVSLILVAAEIPTISFQFTYLLFLILDIMILISAITTYIYFYTKVYNIRRREANTIDQNNVNRPKLFIKKFKVPCYIVMTYICFNLTSTIMMTASQYMKNRRYAIMTLIFSHVFTIVGVTSDACIYIFANKNVRKLLSSICSKKDFPVYNMATIGHCYSNTYTHVAEM